MMSALTIGLVSFQTKKQRAREGNKSEEVYADSFDR